VVTFTPLFLHSPQRTSLPTEQAGWVGRIEGLDGFEEEKIFSTLGN
jgi:hypothetical protein